MHTDLSSDGVGNSLKRVSTIPQHLYRSLPDQQRFRTDLVSHRPRIPRVVAVEGVHTHSGGGWRRGHGRRSMACG